MPTMNRVLTTDDRKLKAAAAEKEEEKLSIPHRVHQSVYMWKHNFT